MIATMGLLFKIVPPRRFRYGPRYYNFEQEVDPETGKRRIHFRRLLRHPRQAKKPLVLWILVAIAALCFYWQLRHGIRISKPLQVEPIKLEKINP
ncbi:hypothetical protein L0337_29550 [candidate division KSB1 bacterium]|nr:hypothetical protein [candidate division KSB1 bacterium]